MKVLAEYQNGNLKTILYSDGTRVRYTDDDEFRPAFAENVDVHISDKCDMGCKMCYANCKPTGRHADLMDWRFLDSLHAGTEMALNLNFPRNPEIPQFLELLKHKCVVTNVTVNQHHFETHEQAIANYYSEGLIHGLGVSLKKPTPEFIERIKKYPNAVIHVINGIITQADLDLLRGNDLKILILGYKNLGRGTSYFKNNGLDIALNQDYLYQNLKSLLPCFKVVSFDNLALEQLAVKRLLSNEEWERFYGGDDGTFTFFINLVDGYFAKNSLSDVHYPIEKKTMDEMFAIIRGK